MNRKFTISFCALFLFFLVGMQYAQAQISGTVYNDVNGLTDNTVNGTGANAGGLNAVLINTTSGNVAAVTAVAANGTYTFAAVASAAYNVLITTNTAVVGNTPPAIALPTNWVSTGEFLGTGTGSDGTVNATLSVGTTAAASNANFAIEQLPNTNTSTATGMSNPGGVLTADIAATNFGGTDPDGGVIDSIRITTFPTNTTSLIIGANTYTTGTFPAGGVYVQTNAAGQPIPVISIDPVSGAVSVVITYAAVDNAVKQDPTPGTLTIPFTNTIKGTVFNDVNGLLGIPVNTIDGVGSNAGGLNVVAVNTATNTVTAFSAVPANGIYTVTGIPNASFNLLITTAAATVGNPPPGVTLPANWVSTGEFWGTTTAGNDGTVNSILPLGAISDNVEIANFGIEQLPNTNVSISSPISNPGGTTSAAIPATNFGGTDPDGGVIDSIRILTFPTNTTTITINGTPYTAITFPAAGVAIPTNAAGQPTQPITIDPVDGTIDVVITYRVTDNAGKPDPTPGTLTIPFQVSGLNVIDNRTAAQLVDKLTGEGVVVLNPTMTCPGVANGTFDVIGTTNLGLDSGIVLTSGRAKTIPGGQGVNGPNTGAGPDFDNGAPGDAALNNILAGLASRNACVLEFDFVPAGDSVKFDYVFGSSEYLNYSCSQWNDMFAFLISGPGFATPFNMATVPGTTIPICVNSTTNPAVNATPGNTADCIGMGTGSPFIQYYVNNTGGATITYRGFTSVFTASAQVSPCDTFHLKLAIADGSAGGTDGILDSGVFLKAGSLNSAALYVKTMGGGGLEVPFTNTVRGCPPGVVRISRSGNFNQPVTIPLDIDGTAVNGVDYTAIPTSVTIPAGDSVISLQINGIPMIPAVGPKSVVISIISPYTCGNGEPVVLASDTIMIYDSIYVKILVPDTAICRGRQVYLPVEADTILNFTWTPAATVSDPLGQNVTVSPTGPTTYTVSVTLPVGGSGCAPSTASVFIDVKDTPQVNLGPDRVTCGDAIQLNAATSPNNPDETFEWTPTTGLSNATIRNPISTPASDIEYAVKVNPGAVGCDGHDTIKVRLLPDHITVLNTDTIVCAGTILQLRADGDTAFSYNWDPEINIADPEEPNTTLNAQTSGYYTLTASYPGCTSMPDSFYVEVQPVPLVNIGPDKVICTYDTIQMFGGVLPAAYPNYTYDWTPGSGLTDSTVKSPVFTGDASVTALSLKVTTPIGCQGSDTMSVIVFAGDFMSVMPEDTGACPPAKIQLAATGAHSYDWSPAYGLNATDIANPVASPVSSTLYTLIGTRNYTNHACYDTQMVNVKVYPSATINLPESVQIWPGESYQIDPGGNCLYFQWFPPSGLSADNISNPVAQPEVRTRYFVTASTEEGCIIKDSIDILVNAESVLEVPNAFSPTTGDFKILKRGIANLKYFRIFNRWGNKVFETTDIDKGWNGRFNEKEQPVGVYIYSIEATTSTGKPFRKDGNLTLVR